MFTITHRFGHAALLAVAAFLALAVLTSSQLRAQETPVTLTFEAAPTVLAPGDSASVTIGIKNNTAAFRTTWLDITFKDAGIPLFDSGPVGPIPLLPFFRFSTTQQFAIPATLPPGLYTIEVSAGPSKTDTRSFDTASQTLLILVDLPHLPLPFPLPPGFPGPIHLPGPF